MAETDLLKDVENLYKSANSGDGQASEGEEDCRLDFPNLDMQLVAGLECRKTVISKMAKKNDSPLYKTVGWLYSKAAELMGRDKAILRVVLDERVIPLDDRSAYESLFDLATVSQTSTSRAINDIDPIVKFRAIVMPSEGPCFKRARTH